jgi:hypothetical protein
VREKTRKRIAKRNKGIHLNRGATWMAAVFPSISLSLNVGREAPERTHLTVCLLRPIHGIGFSVGGDRHVPGGGFETVTLS